VADAPRRAGWRKARSRWCLAWAAGAVLTALAAGCAAVPTSGVVQSATIPPGPGGAAGSGRSCCGLIMQGPDSDWGPQQIVSNFLLASANFANDHAIAREYLTKAANKAWHPGSAVTVVAQPPTVTLARRPFRSQNAAVVQVQAQEVATLSGSGQYSPAPGGQQQLTQQFGVQLVNHRWRIALLPSGRVGQPSRGLLLTKALFQLAYEPRNLYYFDPSGKALVPDPVFVPIDSSDPATGLVQALLRSPAGWLEGAAVSAFPPEARLRRPVQVPPGSKTAIVDLSLPRGTTTDAALRAMGAQLVWTLTSPSYSPAPAQSVQLELNGRPSSPDGISIPVQTRRDYPQPVLDPPDHQDMYYLTAGGAVRVLHGSAPSDPSPASQALPGQVGSGQIPLRVLAVSPDERYLAGIAGPSDTVYISALTAAARSDAKSAVGSLTARITGSGFTAVSWDRRDDLWVAGKVSGQSGVWVVAPGSNSAVPVSLPVGTGPVTALRVAPDGVRIAMITSHGSLLLGAIIRDGNQVSILQSVAVGTDVTDPSALTWYDADHLLVVAQSSVGPRLEEVPVDGDRSTAMGVEPNMVSITAAGPLNPLYAGQQTDHLLRSIGVGELWSSFVPGTSAVYPG
jgi:Lipoprotein LpqB beta-propeller domain/Sporulation and spore germination